MTPNELIEYCLTKQDAYTDFPFGIIPVCVKVGGRLFAQLYPNPEDFKLTLNCDVETGLFYKTIHEGTVIRAYHCPSAQQPYFFTVLLNGKVSDNELKKMIDSSYAVVLSKLQKKSKKF